MTLSLTSEIPLRVGQLSETELVARCRIHDRVAQRELYCRYNRAMFSTCVRMLRNREDAEDILQGSFADVFAKLDDYRADSTIGAWIKRIVVNNCINFLNKRRLMTTELMDNHAENYCDDQDQGLVIGEDISREVAAINAAILRLPAGYRTVLNLYLFEGYDHQEIAQVLGISEQTSKSQYSRAKSKVRELLTDRLAVG